MRRVLIAIGALLAAAGIGALAASLAGGDPAPPPFRIEPDRELGPLPVERVGEPPKEARRAGARGGGKEQLEFFQTQPLEIAPHTEEGATLSCPKGYKAAGGYYQTGNEGTLLGLTAPEISEPPTGTGSDSGAPASKRNWVIAILNTTEQADQMILGVSCLRKR